MQTNFPNFFYINLQLHSFENDDRDCSKSAEKSSRNKYSRIENRPFRLSAPLRFTGARLQFRNLHSRVYLINYATAHLSGIFRFAHLLAKYTVPPHLSQFYLIMAKPPPFPVELFAA